MFEEHGLGYYGAEAAASCKTGGGREEMDEKDHGIAHLVVRHKVCKRTREERRLETPEVI
jgi:hypothetical protein